MRTCGKAGPLSSVVGEDCPRMEALGYGPWKEKGCAPLATRTPIPFSRSSWQAGPIWKKDIQGDRNRHRRAGLRGMSEPAAPPASIDPAVMIRSRPYIAALVLAAVLGVP